MKRFPNYDRTVLERIKGGSVVYHVRLQALNECGDRIAGRGKDKNPDVATARAFKRLYDENDATVADCIRRGRHSH